MGSQENPTESVHRLVTRERLVRDLGRLGVKPGQTLLVHASIRRIGLVDGGAQTVVTALRDAVGKAGNIVVPTGTAENSVTSRSHKALIAKMTEDEVRAFRRNMPGFYKDATPSTTGALGEALRTVTGAVRSDHPQSSFAAIGPEAEYLMADHHPDCHLGEYSPLAKLYKMAASVLLLGVGYNACSAFHLAEYRYIDSPPNRIYSCAVIKNGRTRWIGYIDVVLDDQDFGLIGQDLELEHEDLVKRRNVGNASSRLIPMVLAVDHAQNWMARHRT